MTTERQRFEELFRTTHYVAVTKYAVRRVGPDSAAEVVSETFLTAWRRLADVPDDPLPWLYATARRVVANEHRRRGRAGRLTERVTGSTPPDSPDHADAVVERMRVREALEQLSPRDREALMLAEWEQLAPADAAKVLGCSPATYRVRLHRARRRIATLLHPDEDVPSERTLALVPLPSRGTTS